MNKQPLIRINKPGQRGFTLFEYCAGAAVILGVVWLAMGRLGVEMSGLIDSIAGWAKARSTQIGANPGS